MGSFPDTHIDPICLYRYIYIYCIYIDIYIGSYGKQN